MCGHRACDRVACRKAFYGHRVRLCQSAVTEAGCTRFFTLTLDPAMVTGDPWEYIAYPWSKLRKRIAKRRPGWQYLAVLERHKDRDWPHVHGFTDIWLDKRDWTDQWAASGGGRITWIEAVDTVNVGEYVSKQLDVAKYLGKQQLTGTYHAGKQVRTLWRSKGMRFEWELTKEPGWCILKEPMFDGEGRLTEYGERWRIRNGAETQCGGQDVEATCRTVPQAGS